MGLRRRGPFRYPFPPPFPVGIAGGFFKDPEDLPASLLFSPGFVEVGSLTLYPKEGNPPPRIYRLEKDHGIWNRLGFPNPGYHQGYLSLRRYLPPFPVGVNLGVYNLLRGKEEWLEGLRLFFPVGDFFVLNPSSPNTEGLRKLLSPSFLQEVGEIWEKERSLLARFYDLPPPPVFIKIHPDLSPEEMEEILVGIGRSPWDGVVAFNTTTRRDVLKGSYPFLPEGGGISGFPLRKVREEWEERGVKLLSGKIWISAGGIYSGEDLMRSFQRGVFCVEVYTVLIYEGPFWFRKIREYLRKKRLKG